MKAESRLYGRRVVGDLDLGLEPARITGHGNRQWAEIISPGGRLPGRPEQHILEATALPNYRIGTRRLAGDRTFHYCYAPVEPIQGGAPQAQIGVFYNSNLHYHGFGAALPVNGGQVLVAAGVTQLDWAYRLPALDPRNIPIAAHDLQEALLVSYGERVDYLIEDNDAYVAGPLANIGTVRLYLKQPVWRAFGGGGAVNSYIYPNTYAQCVNPDPGIVHDALPYVPGILQGWGGVVAVPLIDHATPCYFWGQTWGPLPLINGIWGINVGDRPNVREFHFDWAGRIVYRPGAELLNDAHMQRGGYILSSQLVMLQLAP